MITKSTDKFSFLDKNQQKALKEYQEYKKLRTVVVRPIRAFNDIEAILKDLQGEGFLLSEEEIERSKKPGDRTTPKSKSKRLYAR